MSCAIKSLKINKISTNHKESVKDITKVHDCVIVEKLFCVNVESVTCFTLLCTPIDLEALVAGALFERGIIERNDDLEQLEVHADLSLIKVKIKSHHLGVEKYRKHVGLAEGGVTSGKDDGWLFANAGIEPNRGYLQKIEFAKIAAAIKSLQARQEIFPRTGAAHAALLFKASGEELAFAEDIGRHNALDKVIGKCILAGQSLQGGAVALSSRISYEMAAKAARAGIELVAAVSAPSSLAIMAAQHWNMTLCGFMRGERANIYCKEERVG